MATSGAEDGAGPSRGCGPSASTEDVERQELDSILAKAGLVHLRQEFLKEKVRESYCQ